MKTETKTLIVFIAGIILGGTITGILVDKMSSKMWIDMHMQIKAHDLTQTTKALEELRNDNNEMALIIMENKIDDDIEFTGNDMNISESTRKMLEKAVNRAREYRKQYPINE